MSHDTFALVNLSNGNIYSTSRCPANAIWEQTDPPGFIVVAVTDDIRSHLHKVDLSNGPPYRVVELTDADLTQRELARATEISNNLLKAAVARGEVVEPYPTPEQLELSL